MPADIAVHASDRGILIGTSGCGKSTLAAYLLAHFRMEYPQSRILVLDTKPRWRGEFKADGTKTTRMYKRFVKGDVIPGAMVMSSPRDWSIVWDKDVNPSQTVIAQRLSGTQASNVAFQTWVSERFFETQDARRPSMIYWDEGMDFFTTSGSARNSDIVQRCYRAGRELNMASVIGVQRPKGINLQCLTETSYCALFHIRFTMDVKRLWEMGWPPEVPGPTEQDFDQFRFRLWRARVPGAPMYHLQHNGR